MLGLVNVDFWFQIYDKWQELWAGLFMRKGLMIVVYFDFIWMGLMRIVYSCHFWCAACSMLYSFLPTHTAATHMKPFAITFFSSYQEGRRFVRSNMQLSPLREELVPFQYLENGCTRWFNLPLLSSSWRPLSLWKGHSRIPKRLKNCQAQVLVSITLVVSSSFGRYSNWVGACSSTRLKLAAEKET